MKKNTKMVAGEYIFGIHPVVELLKAKQRKLLALYTTKPEPKRWHEIQQLMPSYPVTIHHTSRDALVRMAGTTDHQGVVALVQPFPFRKKMFEPTKEPFIVLLDGIQDPRNVGAILRSAYCTGVTGVVLCKKEGAPLNAVALKSSAGLAEHLSIMLAPSATKAAEELKNAGYNLYLAAFNGVDARACEFKQPCCVVIGNEATGINSAVYKFGTQVTLPQRSADISYNASVAAGLLLFLAGTKNKSI